MQGRVEGLDRFQRETLRISRSAVVWSRVVGRREVGVLPGLNHGFFARYRFGHWARGDIYVEG